MTEQPSCIPLSSTIGQPVHNPAGDQLGTLVDVLYAPRARALFAAVLHAPDGSLHGVHPASLRRSPEGTSFLLDAQPADFTAGAATAAPDVGSISARWRSKAPDGLGHASFFFSDDVATDYAAKAPIDAPPPEPRRWYPGAQRHTRPDTDTRRGGVMRDLPSENAATTS